MEFFREFLRFAKARKKLWLLPILLILLLLASLIVTVQGTAVAPFIYAVF